MSSMDMMDDSCEYRKIDFVKYKGSMETWNGNLFNRFLIECVIDGDPNNINNEKFRMLLSQMAPDIDTDRYFKHGASGTLSIDISITLK